MVCSFAFLLPSFPFVFLRKGLPTQSSGQAWTWGLSACNSHCWEFSMCLLKHPPKLSSSVLVSSVAQAVFLCRSVQTTPENYHGQQLSPSPSFCALQLNYNGIHQGKLLNPLSCHHSVQRKGSKLKASTSTHKVHILFKHGGAHLEFQLLGGWGGGSQVWGLPGQSYVKILIKDGWEARDAAQW